MKSKVSLPSDGRRRIVSLALRPCIDGGRYPIKRVLGERVLVEADLICDGHDILNGRLLHRHESSAEWTAVPLIAGPNDVWRAAFVVDRLGRHRYVVEGWVDAFATWRRGLERKVAAGVNVELELAEGAALIEDAFRRIEALARVELEAAARTLRATGDVESRIQVALAPGLAATMARAADRSQATRHGTELEVNVERPLAACSSWYEMFPRSFGADGRHGTFREAERHLDYVAELGFDIVYLPPIHPIGTSFRKGPDNTPTAGHNDPGSPWAIGGTDGGHAAVHPALGTLADFDHFVGAARDRGIEVALDIAFQASPDHPWVREHPSWFRARPDGSIQYAENPPKKYQDVYPFDFESEDWKALWEALRDVFLFWAKRGVRVFRVDNPHTKPVPFWEWLIRSVQSEFADAIFLAEAFTRPKVMYALAKAGFSQSYTYFTWRVTKAELTAYLEELTQTEAVEFFRPNFWPTTPDILPESLQHAGRAAFASRFVLAATLSSNYGIYGPSYELLENVPRPGAEELATNEKYQLRNWDLERPDSLRHFIARVNAARRNAPALRDQRSLRFHRTDSEKILCYSKRSPDGTSVVLVVVNLDPRYKHSAWLDLDLDALGIEEGASYQVHDLLGDERAVWSGARVYVELDPDVLPANVFAVRRSVRTENEFEYFL